MCFALASDLVVLLWLALFCFFFFFQAEDGIRDLVRSRGLGDVYKRQFHSKGHRAEFSGDLRPDCQGQVRGMVGGREELQRLSLIHI